MRRFVSVLAVSVAMTSISPAFADYFFRYIGDPIVVEVGQGGNIDDGRPDYGGPGGDGDDGADGPEGPGDGSDADSGREPTLRPRAMPIGREGAEWSYAFANALLNARVSDVEDWIVAPVAGVAFPEWADLSLDGVLSGVPFAPGAYEVSVTAVMKDGRRASRVYGFHVDPIASNVVQLAVHDNATYVVTDQGHVWRWSSNQAFREPTRIPFIEDVKSISQTGYRTVCAIKFDGSLWCWGANNQYQLADGTQVGSGDEAKRVPIERPVQSVSSNHYGACAVDIDNRTWCWGYNMYGLMADGTTNVRELPGLVTAQGWGDTGILPPYGAQSVSLGGHTACVAGPKVWCWGYNGQHQAGSPGGSYIRWPYQVEDGIAPLYSKEVSVGGNHACAVDQLDRLVCWGRTPYSGVDTNTRTPTVVLRNVLTAGTTDETTCAITHRGREAWCFGHGTSGQLGNGSSVHSWLTPVKVSDIPGRLVQIDSGYRTSCALTSEGDVWCWGRQGTLGTGTLLESSTPVKAKANWKSVNDD